MAKHEGYTVSDGKLVLLLDPELITQAETVEEAFENARDAAVALKESRRKFVGQLASARRG